MFNKTKIFPIELLIDTIDGNGVVRINSLGERIKKIRKEKKMTLAEVAGDRLTKGMLSLIENGKAQPSMESLRYIAERIGVEVSTLLDENHIEELRTLLFEIEKEYNNIFSPFELRDKDVMIRLLHRILSVREKLHGKNYEEIRLLDLYTRLNTVLNYREETITMSHVIAFYEKIHAYSQVISCYSFLSGFYFNKNDYQNALKWIQEAEKRTKPYEHLIDKLSILDMHYILTVLYGAIDDPENSHKHLNFALDIAHENRIYYRLDDFYRYSFVLAIQQGDEEKSAYYLKKLKQHADFTEDELAHNTLVFCQAHYMNMIDKDYEQVHSLNQHMKKSSYGTKVDEHIFTFYRMEQTFAYWAQGHYNEAIQTSEDLSIPFFTHHPIDLAIMYRSFAVRALCFLELGEKEVAKREILYAYHGVMNFTNSIYKTFIEEAYKKIQL